MKTFIEYFLPTRIALNELTPLNRVSVCLVLEEPETGKGEGGTTITQHSHDLKLGSWSPKLNKLPTMRCYAFPFLQHRNDKCLRSNDFMMRMKENGQEPM